MTLSYYFFYRIAAVYIRSQGTSRSSVFFLKVLLLWEDTLSRYVPFFLLWLPAEGNVATDSFSGLNFDVVPILG